MEAYDLVEAAQRSGVGADQPRRFGELGVVSPNADHRFTAGDVRRAGLARSLIDSGIPLEGLEAVAFRDRLARSSSRVSRARTLLFAASRPAAAQRPGPSPR